MEYECLCEVYCKSGARRWHWYIPMTTVHKIRANSVAFSPGVLVRVCSRYVLSTPQDKPLFPTAVFFARL